MTGMCARPPGREQVSPVAVVDDVSLSRMRRAVLPRHRRHLGNVVVPVPGQGTTASLSLTAGGGGTFRISFAGRREFGDQTTRDLSDGLPCVGLLHTNPYGASNVRSVGKSYQTNGDAGDYRQ